MTTRKLHILNFSHDEALASTSKGGGESKAARMLAADLGLLPAYWAGKDDLILVPDGAGCLDHKLPRGAEGRVVAESELKEALRKWPVDGIEPWGWDGLLVRRLEKLGVPPALLPTEEQLADIRRLSSRKTAVSLLPLLREEVEGSTGQSWFCDSADEAWQIAERLGRAVIKKPWSSSGRGLKLADRTTPKTSQQYIASFIARQGAVEVEPLYDRILDLAMEFEAKDGGEVAFVGLSVFASKGFGQYAGNWVASDNVLLSRIPKHLHRALCQSRESLEKHLRELIDGKYQGPLGVDMMVVEEDGALKLHPCVEVNLRRTMGHVAMSLRKLLKEKRMGLFLLDSYYPDREDERRLTPYARNIEAIMI